MLGRAGNQLSQKGRAGRDHGRANGEVGDPVGTNKREAKFAQAGRKRFGVGQGMSFRLDGDEGSEAVRDGLLQASERRGRPDSVSYRVSATREGIVGKLLPSIGLQFKGGKYAHVVPQFFQPVDGRSVASK